VHASSAKWVANERRPGGRALAIRRRRQTMALQDIADRLMAYTIAQIGQRPGNPVITPVPVLLGPKELSVARPCASPAAGLGHDERVVELVGGQLAIPGQDGVGLSHSCDLGESRASAFRFFDPTGRRSAAWATRRRRDVRFAQTIGDLR
jgi:hypothetical protein